MTSFLKFYKSEIKSLGSIPLPSSISYMWNFGSLLGICLMIQIFSGLFLTYRYSSSLEEAFDSVMLMMDDVFWGWTVRLIHCNGASFFFIFIYMHIGRGIYFGSSSLSKTWLSGLLIFILSMMTAFLGYVLPWGQMSYWGATVITNLLSSVPYLGESLVVWIWGGFSISEPTLYRFFSLHFLTPLIIVGVVMSHLIFLHESGSSNPLGVSPNSDKIWFHPYFSMKDFMGFVVFLIVFMVIVAVCPDLFMDPDNYTPANPMSTPIHIQPEWYFLFAYAILRSVPSKLGGVVALVMSIFMFIFLPLNPVKSRFSTFKKLNCLVFFLNFSILSWLGSMPVEEPFSLFSKILSFGYFIGIFLMLL
nr:cytochrome b [Alcedoecus sp.]